MSEEQVPQEVAVSSESAPLLGANSSGNGVLAESRNNGTFESSSHSSADVGTSQSKTGDSNSGNDDGSKIKVNMASLLPALAIGVSLEGVRRSSSRLC